MKNGFSTMPAIGAMRVASFALLAANFALLVTQPVQAQGFPAKPLRMVTEFVADSGGDALLRLVAGGMSTHLGQPVIIENRAGAGGVVARKPCRVPRPTATPC